MCMGVLFRCVEVGVVSGAWVMGVLFGSMGVSFGCGGGGGGVPGALPMCARL